MNGPRRTTAAAAPTVPPATFRLPLAALWWVPLLFVLAYVLAVETLFPGEARWEGHLYAVALLLLALTLIYSLLWFGVAYLASRFGSGLVALGFLHVIVRVPGLNRHALVQPPTRPDSPKEVWGRFGILFAVTLAFELILLLVVFQLGDLAPHLANDNPRVVARDTGLVGAALALLLAPASSTLLARLRVRITDSLEFSFFWLALLLLVIGGSTILVTEILPAVVGDPSLFFTSVLLYAPAAWYISLGFSRAEGLAQADLVARAWKARSARIHFGRLRIVDEPEGSAQDV